MPPDPGVGPEPYSFGDLSFVSWIRVARIQGRAYEELYSPAALRQSDQVRQARVKVMADEVIALMQRSEDMNVRFLSLKISREGTSRPIGTSLASSEPLSISHFFYIVFFSSEMMLKAIS